VCNILHIDSPIRTNPSPGKICPKCDPEELSLGINSILIHALTEAYNL
jgi:hypothetical protein